MDFPNKNFQRKNIFPKTSITQERKNWLICPTKAKYINLLNKLGQQNSSEKKIIKKSANVATEKKENRWNERMSESASNAMN